MGNTTQTADTPSQAIELGLCPMCLGHGDIFKIVEGKVGPCSGCNGGKTLEAMTKHQCPDGDCQDHGC